MMKHALSIDVEDYWSIISRDMLHQEISPTRHVVKNTVRFLEILSQFNIKATFFILGEVAKAFPHLVKEIAQSGHEIGAHGFYHKQIFKLNPDSFRKEISDCKKMLEDIASVQVYGHRAPAFSVAPATSWSLDVIAECGFEYDSSIFPIKGKRYGWPNFSQDIVRLSLPSGHTLVEVPMTTLRLWGGNLPIAGGGYLRHFPYKLTHYAICRLQKERPVIVYMHPYEMEIAEDHLETSKLSITEKLRVWKLHCLQLRNRKTVKAKLLRLLSDFDFTTIKNIIEKSNIQQVSLPV
jgi:polysaccharide deacetylase family protein (PEP-CTERM system associated)